MNTLSTMVAKIEARGKIPTRWKSHRLVVLAVFPCLCLSSLLEYGAVVFLNREQSRPMLLPHPSFPRNMKPRASLVISTSLLGTIVSGCISISDKITEPTGNALPPSPGLANVATSKTMQADFPVDARKEAPRTNLEMAAYVQGLIDSRKQAEAAQVQPSTSNAAPRKTPARTSTSDVKELNRRTKVTTEAYAQDLIDRRQFDDAARIYWNSAIRNPVACKGLLVDFYASKLSKRTEDKKPHEYAAEYLQRLADAIYPKEKAEDPGFPRFAFVAEDDAIQSKLNEELWSSRDKEKIERAIRLAGWRLKIAEGVYARKLEVGEGEFFPLISLSDAKKLRGTVRTTPVSGWKLCLLEKPQFGPGAVHVTLVDDPYLELCKREFRLMKELCRKLGAKSIVCFDEDVSWKHGEQNGEGGIAISKGGVFDAEANVKYQKTYEDYASFFEKLSCKFNGGKGSAVIRRGLEEYSAELRERLENDKQFRSIWNDRMDEKNQATTGNFSYSIEKSGYSSLNASIQAGCRILGIPFGAFVSASWEQSESWEKRKKWGLHAEFPISKVVD